MDQSLKSDNLDSTDFDLLRVMEAALALLVTYFENIIFKI